MPIWAWIMIGYLVLGFVASAVMAAMNILDDGGDIACIIFFCIIFFWVIILVAAAVYGLWCAIKEGTILLIDALSNIGRK